MSPRSVVQVLPFLAAVFVIAGCTSGRELVGNWTAVDTATAPAHMVKLVVTSSSEMTLDNGEMAAYVLEPKDHTVKITFANGNKYTYGFSRSGEDLTLVDAGRRIRYRLDQG